MKGIVWVLMLMFVFSVSQAQIHVNKLVIKSKQVYSFDQSDIVVADTLIMEDSSRIVLNGLKRENYLHSKVMVIGKGCAIQGGGVDGKSGRSGRPGNSPVGPCKNGMNGTMGGRGLDGTHGVNLFLYLDKITIGGTLTIDLHGGDGGAGGSGGEGGSGTSGTVHCNGGNGGIGGNAGDGGNGGDGGSITIHCPSDKSEYLNKHLKFRINGGRFGKGGRGGYPGASGQGPPRRNGKLGVPGSEGLEGKLGKYGKISFVH